MKRKVKDRVEAEVMLRPADPTADRGTPVRAETVHRFAAPAGAAASVAERLRDLGFEVTAQSPTSVSISGPKSLFEQVFKSGAAAGRQGGDALTVPEEISEHVEGVYVQAPPTYFDY